LGRRRFEARARSARQMGCVEAQGDRARNAEAEAAEDPMTLTVEKEDQRFLRAIRPTGVEVALRPAARPASVRVATHADERSLFDLFMMAAQENAMAPVCEANVVEAIKTATERRGAIIGVIDGDRDDLAGAVALVMAPFWYSAQFHCEELLNFVHPNYRQGERKCARDLLEFAKWWADQLGMSLLMGDRKS